MKTIDIYIIKKFLGTFFYAIGLLVVIVIIFDFSERIDEFLGNNAPAKEIIFSYYFNFIPYFVNLFAYLFTFISVIFFTSKLAMNTEVIAMLSSGISYWRFLRPYLVSSIFLAILSFVLANFIIPHTNKKLVAFENTYLKGTRTNRDVNIHIQVNRNTFIYLESYNALQLTGHRFSLEKIENKKLIYKLNSDRIKWDSISECWIADRWTSRSLEGHREIIERGTDKPVMIDIKPQDFITNKEDIKTMDLMELNQRIEEEQMKGTTMVINYEVEKHKRIANPFATLILTFIGVSISSRKVRGGIGLHLGVGITITFSYILFMQISTVFGTNSTLSPFWAAWMPNIFFGVMALIMIRVAPK